MALIALTGLDYRSSVDGSHIRVEIGEEVNDLTPASADREVAAGNIEVVVDVAVAPVAPAPSEPVAAPVEPVPDQTGVTP